MVFLENNMQDKIALSNQRRENVKRLKACSSHDELFSNNNTWSPISMRRKTILAKKKRPSIWTKADLALPQKENKQSSYCLESHEKYFTPDATNQ